MLAKRDNVYYTNSYSNCNYVSNYRKVVLAMFKRMKDPVSSLTHLLGAVISIPLTVLLIVQSARYATPWHVVSFSIFGAAMLALYTASAVYHMLPISPKAQAVLRRIDHMMIFVLIAGTYTPICLLPLRGAWGYTLLGLVWGAAAGGIVLKALWMDAPRWLSSAIYVLMGWIVIIAVYPLVQTVSANSLLLLLGGGVTYTIGAVIYALKKPYFNFRFFGFHELFHLFVMGGSAFHVVFMFKLLAA